MKFKDREFLLNIDACDDALRWAERFETMALAFAGCHRSDWMRYALECLSQWDESAAISELLIEKMRREKWGPEQIRATVGNPFAEVPRVECWFCVNGRPLTRDELKDSQLVGTLPRCYKHIAQVDAFNQLVSGALAARFAGTELLA